MRSSNFASRMRDWADKVSKRLSDRSPREFWGIGLAVLAAGIGFWLRMVPKNSLDYLQAADSYMTYRIPQHIALEGVYPMLDFMRYFPYEMPTYVMQVGAPTIPALFYWMGPFLIFDSYLGYAQTFTPLVAGFTVILAYFLGQELWDKKAGVGSAFAIATIPALMHRGSAGFFQRDQLGVFFMFVSMIFFVRAWKEKDWRMGILSGIGLGAFTVTWGGSSMLWMLYPLTVGAVIFLDEEVENLVAAYTPTVIIGGLIGASFNAHRFWITGSLFIGNLGILAVLWLRHLVEEFNLVEEERLPLVIPASYLVGGVLALLSPYYYQPIWNAVSGVLAKATTPSGAIIAGTVSENQGMGAGRLLAEMGSSQAGYVAPLLQPVGSVLNFWTVSLLGFAMITTVLGASVARKYIDLEEDTIRPSIFYTGFFTSLFAAILLISIPGQSSTITAMIPAAIIGGIAVAGSQLLGTASEYRIRDRWVLALPMFWFISNVMGMFSMTRLAFLAGFPVGMAAGIGISKAWNTIMEADLSGMSPKLQYDALKPASVGLILAVLVVLGGSASYALTDNISQSPSENWDENLEFLENETDPDDVVLSWWDYGYWFQSIGRRAAVADGGNMAYYTEEGPTSKVPHPIADFLTSENPSKHSELLEKHSVDYMVLDYSMVSKYGAVTQIANRNNSEFSTIQRIRSTNTLNQALQNGELKFSVGGDAEVFMPVENQNGSITIPEAPTLQTENGRGRINCVSTTTEDYEFYENNDVGYCLAIDPVADMQSAGFTPVLAGLMSEKTFDTTFTDLYFREGRPLDWVDKEPEGSNGYVQTWEVEDLP